MNILSPSLLAADFLNLIRNSMILRLAEPNTFISM